MPARFEVGDLVRLKSGGPVMTINRVNSYSNEFSYQCQWFAGKKLEDGLFPHDSLLPAGDATAPAKEGD